MRFASEKETFPFMAVSSTAFAEVKEDAPSDVKV